MILLNKFVPLTYNIIHVPNDRLLNVYKVRIRMYLNDNPAYQICLSRKRYSQYNSQYNTTHTYCISDANHFTPCVSFTLKLWLHLIFGCVQPNKSYITLRGRMGEHYSIDDIIKMNNDVVDWASD